VDTKNKCVKSVRTNNLRLNRRENKNRKRDTTLREVAEIMNEASKKEENS
jgi:hypothetical protein